MQTYSIAPPTVLLRNGSFIGKTDSLNAGATQTEAITIDNGATVQAANITATDIFTSAALTLSGPITGAVNTTLHIQPTLGGNTWAPLRIAPTTANTGFVGNVILQGGAGAAAGRFGALVLGGTGALSNINSLTINSGGLFRLANSTNPLPAGFQINVGGGARMEWEGTQSYTIAPPTVLFQDTSSFGRKLNGSSISTEAITIANNATVTAIQIGGTSLNTANRLELQGSLAGSATSKILVSHTGLANEWGSLQINSASANPFAGTVEVTGFNAGNQGVLNLTGTGPLANAALLQIQNFGTALVSTDGAANGIDEINVLTGGTLRFRNNTSSTLTQSMLSGTGLIRSEIIVASPIANGTLRPLTLVDTILSPGNSAGTLTIEASTLTLGNNAVLHSEIGLVSDLLDIKGDLVLTPGSELELDSLAGLTVGTYVIAKYSGTLTGQFGSIFSSGLGNGLNFASIDYGTLFNSQITVTIAQIPEPSSGLMALLGMAGVCLARRREQR